MKGIQKCAYMTTSRATASQRNETNRGSKKNIGDAYSPRKSSSGMSGTSKAALGAGALGLGVGGLLGYSKQNRRSKSTINSLMEDKQNLANQLADLTTNTSGAKGSTNKNIGNFLHTLKSGLGREKY